MSRPLHFSLPRRSLAELERRAIDRFDGDRTGPADRLVVNMVRHECTDYDIDQSAERHAAACDAIAAAYPELAAECAAQKARRGTVDSCAEFVAAEVERQTQERRRLVEESEAACRSLAVGQQISVTVKGHPRIAKVAAVGRSMVTLDYTIKSGQARQAKVHAARVTP